MPEWTNKDERQYEHIKDSQLERGKSEDVAKEIAARTVNKHRREDDRTPNTALEDRTVEELRNRAADLHIKGRTRMKKAQLIQAIRQAN